MEVKRWQKIAQAERELNQYLAKTKTTRDKATADRDKKIKAAESILAKYEKNLDSHIEDWENSPSQATDWQIVDFDSMTSTFGAKLERLEDGSIFSSGKKRSRQLRPDDD